MTFEPVFISGREAPPTPAVMPMTRAFPVFKQPLPIRDRTLAELRADLPGHWELLASGIYIRILSRKGGRAGQMPAEVAWLHPPRADPPGRLLYEPSVGQFRAFSVVYVEQARTEDGKFRVKFGRCGNRGESSRWPPGKTVCWLTCARPARFENEVLKVRLREHAHGRWTAVER